MTRQLALLATTALAACGSDTYVIVTVDARAAVHDATALQVTLTNDSSTRTDSLDLGTHGFPVTFSVSASGRSGDLGIAVTATDENMQPVGSGAVATTFGAKTAGVLLDSVDFVINTEYAGDQFLSDDFEASGYQLAALADGTWTAGFRDQCTECNIFGRRFDSAGHPLMTVAAAGTDQFQFNSNLTQSTATVAVAANGSTTMAVWDYLDDTSVSGVACRSIDESGTPIADEISLATDPMFTDVVSIAAMSNGNFVVAWTGSQTTDDAVKTVVVQPDCSPLGGASTVSTVVGDFGGGQATVAASGANVMYAWLVNTTIGTADGADVHVRVANLNGVFSGVDTTLIDHDASTQSGAVRLVPVSTGFALFVRTASIGFMDGSAGTIGMYLLNPAGQIMSGPSLVTDQSKGDNTNGDESFGVTARADGALLVTWHVCQNSDSTDCEVSGRLMRPTGSPVGDVFVIPNPAIANGAPIGDHTRPSAAALSDSFAVAWNDTSHQPPDGVGQAVHGRIIYPPYDDAESVIGAPCGGGQPACATGLACALGTDNMKRCFATCDPSGTPPLCPAGGTCATADTGSACAY